MRYSKQNEEILKVVLSSNSHPNAKQIHKIVKKKIPNISLGTVYRNLNVLTKEGLIKRVMIEDDNVCYDKTLMDHSHIRCVICKKIMDVKETLGQNEILNIENETGFKITDCNFNINGICKDCMKGRKN